MGGRPHFQHRPIEGKPAMKPQIFNAPNGYYVFDVINDSDWQKNTQVKIPQVVGPGRHVATYYQVRDEVKRFYDLDSVFTVFSHYENTDGVIDKRVTDMIHAEEIFK